MKSGPALVLGFLLVACGPPPPPAAALDVADDNLLVPSEAITPDFIVHQRVHASFGERKMVFQAVIQKAEGRLTIVALTLQGTRLFTLEQSGTTVRFERYTKSELPFSPRHILVDIHRSYFRSLASPPASGRRVASSGGELLRETWRRGQLVERTIEIIEAKRPERITIRYGAGGASLLERSIRYHNGYLDYTLVVTPLRFKVIGGAGSQATEDE